MEPRRSQHPLIVLTTLFFMWGFVTVLVDSLIPRLREIFELSYFEAGLVQFAFFIAYGLVSIPAGWLLSRIGYRNGMLLGLLTMGAGCLLFWPAAGMRIFSLFLAGYFILASGMTILQVAANPYVAALGDERGASSRLNLAQAFNSVGTTLAPIVGAMYLLSDRINSTEAIAQMGTDAREAYYVQEASAVQAPFVLLAAALLVLALTVALSRLPRVLEERGAGTYRAAWAKERLRWGAIGIFLYVGAEVAIGSYLVNYFLSMDLANVVKDTVAMSFIAGTLLNQDLENVDAKGIVGAFVALYWGGAMIGRFVGASLTRTYRPATILTIFGGGAITMVLISMASAGLVSMWSILAVGLFNSIMFPTLFSMAIEGLGDLKPKASGILCTAIAGGAVIPPLLGLLIDLVDFKVAFVLLVCCYAYIMGYAMRSKREIT